MIPIRLYLSGFLSYREPMEIDFTGFELACISGPNGAGKSSLLDAITWALFGEARKKDDSLIHSGSSIAEVGLVFAYERNIYQVRRIKPRDKTMALEFQILRTMDGGRETADFRGKIEEGEWKALTERTMRETQALIEKTLRMDYETFTNASFFLQGKADQFTQQRPGDRKRILGSILGLEIWESYRQRAGERRKLVEGDITGLDGRLKEIMAELGEEQERKRRLKELESDLKRLAGMRAAQEAATQTARQAAASLQEQGKLVDAFARQLEGSARRLEETCARLEVRQQEQKTLAAILKSAEEIEKAHADWQKRKVELAQIDTVAAQFREFEKQREEPRTQIQMARARLEQELEGLLGEKERVGRSLGEAAELNTLLGASRTELALAEARLERRDRLDANLQAARQKQADARAENPRLKAEMEELKERIETLAASEEAECPLCGQPLIEVDRLALIERLTGDGKEMGVRYRANLGFMQEVEEQVRDLEGQIGELSRSEADIRQHMARIAQLEQQAETHAKLSAEWDAKGVSRLKGVQTSLKKENYAAQARLQLAEIDGELKKIGYDAAAHDAARQAEEAGRGSETALRELEQARAALAPLKREIADLVKLSAELEHETKRQRGDYEQAAGALAEAQSQAPDLYEAESLLFDLTEKENRLHMDLGAAKQKVAVLEGLKARRKELEGQREEFSHQVQLYKQLERAFSKDGVPALLIEQALPEIESKANETLARLSGGNMSVMFVTQGKYKDKNREDLKETLDIQISDSAGRRDYEMFSGGEAFRVNFAIRLALSEVLAQRAGARLQTLVIDEGFGSQDAQGRQRLVEAINLVRNDFAKILVITHIDELKDAFPNRIEVEKTALGSVVSVV